MVKTPCNCTSYRCGGNLVDRRTQRSHALRDKTAQSYQDDKDGRTLFAQKAVDAEEEVIQSQLDVITGYLAKASLRDAPNLDSTIADISPFLYTPTKESSCRNQRIHRVLERLSEIESTVNTLHDEVAQNLLDSQSASFLNSKSFPLANLIDKCSYVESDLTKITSKSAAVTGAKDAVQKQVNVIRETLQTAKNDWKLAREAAMQRNSKETSIEYSNDHHFKPFLQSTHPLIQLSTFLVITCQVVAGTSRRGCTFIYSLLRYIIQLCLMQENPTLSQRDAKILADFPIDPRTAEKEFNLDAKATVYAICPDSACHASYKPTFIEGSPIPIYPSFCTHRRFGRRCKVPLVRPKIVSGSAISVPIKTFVAYDLKDWLGCLLAQPGLESEMDKAWMKSKPDGEDMTDIFDGYMLRDFKGPDGHLFSQANGEGRYVFSLSVDFFNPLSNKQAGKKVSVGVISLVCLNLPADIRYKTEYMFLAGIIPGPNEPPSDALNHYIRPIVDVFLQLWHPGVWYTKTNCHPDGRLVLCAIICLVCDLIAAKKLAGFGPISHTHFCHICHCARNVHGYGHFEQHRWDLRTNEETRASAQAYADSQSNVESEANYAQTGVRWSELLRLPYFDPTRFVVIDPMHNLFLGVINKHFQDILGIRLEKDTDTEAPVIDLPFSNHWTTMEAVDRNNVSRLMKILSRPLKQDLETEIGMTSWVKKLSNLRLSALELACSELEYLGCKPLPTDTRKTSRFTRSDYARGILAWRRSQVERKTDPYGHATTSTKCGHVFNKEEIAQIHADIASTITPSWLTSVPALLGSAGHGKLKADQWRVLGAVFFPITLMRLWWFTEPGDPRSERCRKILDVTISLLSAVSVATSRKTSHQHAAIYLQHMQAYLNGIQDLFPAFKFVPNHHMALHLPDYILLYGPMHSWWAFPFERMIGMLQRILTNYKEGEYETTIARSFTRSANLRRILEQSGTPEVIQNCKLMFQKLVQPLVRDTLTTDMLSFAIRELEDADSAEGLTEFEMHPTPNSKIPKALMTCILESLDGTRPTSIFVIPTLTIRGITFSVSSRHLGNSSVLIDAGGLMLPVRIEHFVQLALPDHPNSLIMYAAARRYMPSIIQHDPFLSFPFLHAQLWSRKLDSLQLYPVDIISSHFASCPMKWEDQDLMVVVSLSREY